MPRRIRSALMAISVVCLYGTVGVVGVVSPALSQDVRGGASAPESRQITRIALLPVIVHSSDDPRFLREGLADMLKARIDQAGGFEVIAVEDEALATTDLDEALEAGRLLGADYVLFGSFTRFGKGASLDMQCAATAPGSGKTPLREIFVHSGSIGDVIPDLDELVGKLGRFAITGYADSNPAAVADGAEERGEAGLPGGEAAAEDAKARAQTSDDVLVELLSRVEALEAAVAELEGGTDDE